MPERPALDPVAVLAALERHRVAYVVVGELAAAMRGSGVRAAAVELVPSLRADNLGRFGRALDELESDADARSLKPGGRLTADTAHGRLVVRADLEGASYEEVRRQATREPIGSGARPLVASVGDLVRLGDSTTERGRDIDERLRRIAELELARDRGAER